MKCDFYALCLLFEGLRCPFPEISSDQITVEYNITQEGNMSILIKCASDDYIFMKCDTKNGLWQRNDSCFNSNLTLGMFQVKCYKMISVM